MVAPFRAAASYDERRFEQGTHRRLFNAATSDAVVSGINSGINSERSAADP
jgi:hypothetical protein